MRRSDWLPVIVLAAMLAAMVGLSVEAVADPTGFDEPAEVGAPTSQEVEALLDAALAASLEAAAGNPGISASDATLRSRS